MTAAGVDGGAFKCYGEIAKFDGGLVDDGVMGMATGERLAVIAAVPDLLGVPGDVQSVRFRGERVTVIASVDDVAVRTPVGGRREPITDPLALELALVGGENAGWSPQVAIHAVVLAGSHAVRAVRRASRWASFAARVACVPAAQISDRVALEAGFRGVWLIAADHPPRVVVVGEPAPTPGSEQGLAHRLLDETVYGALRGTGCQE